MPSKSKSQKRLMSLALAYKENKIKKVSQEIKDIADSMTIEQLKDYVSTPSENLPERVKKLKEALEKLTNSKVILT